MAENTPIDTSPIATAFGANNVPVDPKRLQRVLTGMAIGKIMGQEYLSRKPMPDMTNAVGLDPAFMMQTEQMVDRERDRRMAFEQQQGNNFLKAAGAVSDLVEDNVEVLIPGTDQKVKIPRSQMTSYMSVLNNYKRMQATQTAPTSGYPKAFLQAVEDINSGDPNRQQLGKMYFQYSADSLPSQLAASHYKEAVDPTTIDTMLKEAQKDSTPHRLHMEKFSDMEYEDFVADVWIPKQLESRLTAAQQSPYEFVRDKVTGEPGFIKLNPDGSYDESTFTLYRRPVTNVKRSE